MREKGGKYYNRFHRGIAYRGPLIKRLINRVVLNALSTSFILFLKIEYLLLPGILRAVLPT